MKREDCYLLRGARDGQWHRTFPDRQPEKWGIAICGTRLDGRRRLVGMGHAPPPAEDLCLVCFEKSLRGRPDKNGNVNLLKWAMCPKCGNCRELRIEVRSTATFTDGDRDTCSGLPYWDDYAKTECPGCGLVGPLAKFIFRPMQPAP